MSLVSVIIPCYNEQTTIRLLLDALYAQTFPRENMEVVIADGMSTDQTRTMIGQFQDIHPDLAVRIVDNPLRSIPSGLNRAIEHSNGTVIVRLDAHSKPYPNYIENSVKALFDGKGDNVGGVWEVRPGNDTWVANSISIAAAHPIGVGDALYRIAEHSGEVDTVPFGCFRKELINRIGPFDESLLTNEDYEFNTRIRNAGGKIWLDLTIRSVYFARATFPDLARQYGRYGYWKWRMLRKNPATLKWRQALPPLFVLAIIGLFLLGIWNFIALILLGLILVIYFVILFTAAIQSAIRYEKYYLVFGLPLAIPVMHFSWGGGFLLSILRSRYKND